MTLRALGAFFFLPVILGSMAWAQQKKPEEQAPPPTDTALVTKPTPIVKYKKPPTEPAIIEDGGFSFEPMYWLNRAQPTLKGGAQATEYGGMDYPGDANPGLAGELSIPAGHSDTLRISYFRIQGNSNTTVSQTADIFGEGYNPGDYIVANYTIQSAKISWDYLGYTWYKHSGKIRLKTLYEAQFVMIGANFDAPLKPITTDSSGNTDYNAVTGSKTLVLPSLGVEFEEALGHHFRWEAKASGFTIPGHSDIWDAQADIAMRVRNLELIAGEKAFHFKTSPQSDEYFVDTLSGAFVGVRYYWGAGER